jgi:probable HAF family extracellular repeat protein
MKPKRFNLVLATTLLLVMGTTIRLGAQENSERGGYQRHNLRYRLIDLGTLGGPNSSEFASPIINNQGAITGAADTAQLDPNAPNCYNRDCFVTHAYIWKKGTLTDLGGLRGGFGSEGNGINDYGQIAGQSLNGLIDPLLGTPAAVAVLWESDGRIIDLGTLGGNESLAATLNYRGQVVGAAANAIPDPFPGPLGFWGTQTRAFLWERGVMRDLGDLGGPDAFAIFVNQRSQIAGVSYTSSVPSPIETQCGQNVPPQNPFRWEKGRMIDLGTLGGICGFTSGLNNRGQVIGQSDLGGIYTAHPFLWDPEREPHLRDLGTLGGTFGFATSLNDAGEVAGGATTSGDKELHAFFWRNGVLTDLGTIGSDTFSVAHSMNAKGQVVGTSGDFAGTPEIHGFLSEQGGPMIDLNKFVPRSSELIVTDGETINDHGVIAGSGMLPNGDFHAIVLIPCGEVSADSDGCREAGEDRDSVQTNSIPFEQSTPKANHRASRPQNLNALLEKVGRRYRGFGMWRPR